MYTVPGPCTLNRPRSRPPGRAAGRPPSWHPKRAPRRFADRSPGCPPDRPPARSLDRFPGRSPDRSPDRTRTGPGLDPDRTWAGGPDRRGKAPGMAQGSNVGPANIADRISRWPPDGQRTEHAREQPHAQLRGYGHGDCNFGPWRAPEPRITATVSVATPRAMTRRIPTDTVTVATLTGMSDFLKHYSTVGSGIGKVRWLTGPVQGRSSVTSAEACPQSAPKRGPGRSLEACLRPDVRPASGASWVGEGGEG